ncbi:MAG: DUF1624 domain-containing protein, partial [Psychromonas sp.]|nr:DUF1624 domain-containing protein [Psychromonas sp.]
MKVKKTERLLALDAFRGFTIAAMILVNTPGSWSYIYPPLAHADWHGCTPTDLVFPFFLFIIGVSMWFSLKKYNYRLSSAAARKILKRTLLIFAIGLFIHAFPFYNLEPSNFRIMGVLQRIAVSFGIAALLILLLRRQLYLWVLCIIVLLLYWY